MAHDVFISYASPDEETAKVVCEYLEEQGVACWFAARDIPRGEDWAAAIPAAVKGSKLVVLILSRHANDSEFVMDELSVARNERKRIVTFRITNVRPTGALELFIGRTQWVNAFAPPLSQHFPTLHAAVKSRLGGDFYGRDETGGGQSVGEGFFAVMAKRWFAAGAVAVLLLTLVWFLAARNTERNVIGERNHNGERRDGPGASPTPSATPISGEIVGMRGVFHTLGNSKNEGQTVYIYVRDMKTGKPLKRWASTKESWPDQSDSEFTFALESPVPLAQCGDLKVEIGISPSRDHGWEASVEAEMIVNGNPNPNVKPAITQTHISLLESDKEKKIPLDFACP